MKNQEFLYAGMGKPTYPTPQILTKPIIEVMKCPGYRLTVQALETAINEAADLAEHDGQKTDAPWGNRSSCIMGDRDNGSSTRFSKGISSKHSKR